MLDAKTNEQYKAFQHEIEFAESGIGKCEDRILELMEESEPLATAVAEAEKALEIEKKQVDQEADEARQRTAADESELADKLAQRKRLVGDLDPKIYANYERIRKRFGLPVLAEGNTGRCGACNIAMRPQFFQDLKRASEPVRCENCHRLLYYHPDIDVEAEQAQANQNVQG
jgi:predicted  nucleic acid-binding Zn-ribbon protein